MEFLSAFVTSPLFRFLFIACAVMLGLGIVMHFGFKSAVALGYGVYDMMVIIFLVALSIGMRGVSADPNALVNQLFLQFYPKWIQPMTDVIDLHNSAGLKIELLLYGAGKLLILAMVIELLEKLFSFLRNMWKNIWVWWLGESAVAVLSVFLMSLIWEKLEQNFPQQVHVVVIAIFVLTVLAVIILGLLSVFGPLGRLLSSELFGFFLTSLIIVVLTWVFAALIKALDLLPKFDAFVQNTLHAASTQALLVSCGTVLLVWVIWYVLYRLLRDRIL